MAQAYKSTREALVHVLSNLKKELESAGESAVRYEQYAFDDRTKISQLNDQITGVENVIATLAGMDEAGIEIKRKPECPSSLPTASSEKKPQSSPVY